MKFKVIAILFGLSASVVHAQNKGAVAAATGGFVAVAGLVYLIGNSNGYDGSFEQYMERQFLDYLIRSEGLSSPQTLKVNLLNSYSTADEVNNAKSWVYHVSGAEFGNFVYISAVGSFDNISKYGIRFSKTTMLKFDYDSWLPFCRGIIKHILVDSSNLTADNRVICSKPDVASVNLISMYDVKGGWLRFKYWTNGWEVTSSSELMPVNEDTHRLFQTTGDLHNSDGFLADYSESKITIYLPEIEESMGMSLNEIILINQSLTP